MAHILFLQGGPGLSCGAERERHGDGGPVWWWEQPRAAPGAPHAYIDMAETALAELRRRVEVAGAPVTLLASSFGAHYAVHLARKAPASVERIVLLAPTWDPQRAIVRVARHIAATRPAPSLEAALADYTDVPGRDRFWQVFAALAQVPRFWEAYFTPQAQAAQRFGELMAVPGTFDAATAVAVLDDHADSGAVSAPCGYTGPVSLVFGAGDPLLDPVQGAADWRAVFPQASVRILPVGHFPLLEASLADCLAGE